MHCVLARTLCLLLALATLPLTLANSCIMPAVTDPAWLAMYFATGKNPNDVGSYDFCSDVTGATYCTVTFPSPIIGSMLPLNVGACLPQNCTDVERANSASVREFLAANMPWANASFSSPAVSVSCPSPDAGPLTTAAIAVIVLTCMLGAAGLSGTVLLQLKRRSSAAQGKRPDTGETLPLIDTASDSKVIEIQEPPTKRADSMVVQLAKCWSLKESWAELMRASDARNRETACLNGVRVFSQGIITVVHTLYYTSLFGFSNMAGLLPPDGPYSYPSFQMITTGSLSVDSFFFLAAFLMTLSMLRKLAKNQSLGVPMMYVHRFLRLTPSYAFCLLFFTHVAVYFAKGPFFFVLEDVVSPCREWGWTNVLYINNMVPWIHNDERMCMNWTWYLANDMQFFLLCPLFVLIYHWRPRVGIAVILSVMCASIIALGITARDDSLYALTPFVKLLSLGDYLTWVYEKPWFRIPTFLIGVLTAIVWHTHKTALCADVTPKQNGTAVGSRPYLIRGAIFCAAAGMCATAMYTSSSFYAHLPATWSMNELAAFTALYRPLWTTGLAIMCLLWFSNPADPIGRMLSSPFWEPLSRLSYGAYLLRPMVVLVVYACKTTHPRYTSSGTAFDAVATWAMAYALAVPLFCLVEKPFMNMETLLFKRLGITE